MFIVTFKHDSIIVKRKYLSWPGGLYNYDIYWSLPHLDIKGVIKACDKGAGIIILKYIEYAKACYKHLTSSQSGWNPYYLQVDALEVERSEIQTKNTLLVALEKNIILEDESHAINAKDIEASRFYCNFKVHKKNEHGQTPPDRQIISG